MKMIPSKLLYIHSEKKQGREVDQEIDGKMKWGRMEGCFVEKGGRKGYITERNWRRSWERLGIVAFCTYQWNQYTSEDELNWNANLMQLGNFIDVFLARHVSGTYAHHQEH